MSRYRQPTYMREEKAAKKNPNTKPGKTSDSKAGQKVLWDRYLSARDRLWFWVEHQVRDEKRYLKDVARVRRGELKECFLHRWDSSGTIRSQSRKIADLEKIMEARGL